MTHFIPTSPDRWNNKRNPEVVLFGGVIKRKGMKNRLTQIAHGNRFSPYASDNIAMQLMTMFRLGNKIPVDRREEEREAKRAMKPKKKSNEESIQWNESSRDQLFRLPLSKI